MPSAQTTKLLQEAIRAAIPDSGLTVSTWAEKRRVLTIEKTNPDRCGPWRNSYVPHLVEIMDCFTQPDCEEITFIKPSQIAGTEFINNCVGYSIENDPGPSIYLGEDETKTKAWLQEYFDLMVRTTPALAALVSDGRGRKSENTKIAKTFPGGRLNAAWATSPATTSSRPARYVYIDERDAMGPTKEGDSTSLARARTETFERSKKIVTVTSPRNRLENPPDAPLGTPRRTPAEWEYYFSDRRKRWVPCPHCGEFQVLNFYAPIKSANGSLEHRCSCPPGDAPCELKHGHVQWDNNDPKTAYYVCANGCVINEEERLEMLQKGEWRAEMPFTGHAGFWLSRLYSTFSSMAKIAKEFILAKADPSGEKMKAFLNTCLAEGYEERDSEIDASDLIELKETYDPNLIPEDVLIIVGAVDVQAKPSRLEIEIKGYGLGDKNDPSPHTDPQSFGIDYFDIEGDPAQADVWKELENVRNRVFRTPSGRELRISAVAIDTGYMAHRVYKFIRRNKGRQYFAVKGANTPGKPIISKPSQTGDPPVRLWTIGTETAKDSIANRLEITKSENGEYPAGYCHFASHYPDHYFKQLRSEKPVTRWHRGRAYRCWELIKEWYRNEALDLFVYCDAVLQIALRVLKTNFATLARKADADRARLAAESLGPIHGPPNVAPEPEQPDDDDEEDEFKIKVKRRRGLFRRSRGNWSKTWKE